MKTVGLCTDEEALEILKDQYKENTGKCTLSLLDGSDFKSYLEQVHPRDESISKKSSAE